VSSVAEAVLLPEAVREAVEEVDAVVFTRVGFWAPHGFCWLKKKQIS